MRLLILHNPCPPGAPPDVRGVLEAVAGVEAACRELGWQATPLPAPQEPRALLRALSAARPDAVLNLVEEYQGREDREALAAALLEVSGLPFTGSGSVALALARDKFRAKALLDGLDLPVPAGGALARGDEPLPKLHYPCIVKPVCLDASQGITPHSLVPDEAAARACARDLIRRFGQAALVEEFVPGRELPVSIVEEHGCARVLPLMEIDYSHLAPDLPRILTYDSKWNPHSRDYQGTPVKPAEGLTPEPAARIAEMALAAYRALPLRDYGRVDVRLDARGAPVVLEVNPNPDISPGAGLARAAAAGGLSYAAFIRTIVEDALARTAQPARRPPRR